MGFNPSRAARVARLGRRSAQKVRSNQPAFHFVGREVPKSGDLTKNRFDTPARFA